MGDDGRKKAGSKKTYEVGHGKPPKHSQIKPGQVLNPNGARTQVGRVNTSFRRMTSDDLAELGNMIMQNDYVALKSIVDNKSTSGDPVIKVWVASIAHKAIKNGDTYAIRELLDRFIGKVPDKLIHAGAVAQVHSTPLTPEEKAKEEERYQQLLKLARETEGR